MEIAPAAPQAKPNNAWKYLVAACCGCALIAIIAAALLGVGIFMTVKQLTAPAEAQVEVFLRSMNAGDDARAYDTFSHKLKLVKSQEWVKGVIKENAELFKIPPEAGPSYSSRRVNNGVVFLRGSYPVANGTVYCKFKVVPEGGTWKIEDLDIKTKDFPPEPEGE